jgi:tetratricopeptide (TPR) repeat protein
MDVSSRKESSSIGWFKLAQLVTHKEKERALALFRLLSYSFDEEAYAIQLEGDILWSFDDPAAAEKYEHAARLYQKNNKVVVARALFEQLLESKPESISYQASLCECHALLGNMEQLKNTFGSILVLLEKKDISIEHLLSIVETIKLSLPSTQVVASFKEFLLECDQSAVAELATYL